MQYRPQPIIIPVPVKQEDTQHTEFQRQLIEQNALLLEEIKQLKAQQEAAKPTKKRRKYEEYSPYKSNGVLRATAQDSVKSYEEFNAIQNYFLERNKIRDWAFWTVGVSLGIRVSDMVLLKVGYFLNDDMTFRERTCINEKKTGKLNNFLITESVVFALTKYFDSLGWRLRKDDYLFRSQKRGHLSGKTMWGYIRKAAIGVGIMTKIGTQSMRKSFMTICACVDKTTLDPYGFTKLQVLANHSDVRTTMRYVGVLKDVCDNARRSVSDFVMGKSDVNELEINTVCDIKELAQRLQDAIDALALAGR